MGYGEGPNCKWSYSKASASRTGKALKTFYCEKGPKGKSKKPTQSEWLVGHRKKKKKKS